MMLEEVMDVLMPGCQEAGVPSFNGIGGISYLEMRDVLLVSSLRQWAEAFAYKLRVSEEEITKSFDANDFRLIRDAILEIYFSHPAVVKAVRKVEGPLFPAGAEVEQIDPELLEAVFCRGKIYREAI